jgi:hypothetical protein
MKAGSHQNGTRLYSQRTLNRLVLAIVTIVAAVGILWLLLPRAGSGPVAPRGSCRHNLKFILLALDAYHDEHGSFPPAYVADKNGRPLYSWRVLILPYIDEKPLYLKYRLDEPWDSPHNFPLSNVTLDAFKCPSEDKGESASTDYLAVVGPHAAWTGDNSVSRKDISDPHGSVIHVVEASQSGIGWAEPRDLYVNQIPLAINPKQGLGISSRHKDCAQVGLCDGSVIALFDDLSRETLRCLLDRDDGQPVGEIGE